MNKHERPRRFDLFRAWILAESNHSLIDWVWWRRLAAQDEANALRLQNFKAWAKLYGL